jgi:hypothetical protein
MLGGYYGNQVHHPHITFQDKYSLPTITDCELAISLDGIGAGQEELPHAGEFCLEDFPPLAKESLPNF